MWESNPSFRAWEALVLTVRPTRLSSRGGIRTHVLRVMGPFWSLSRHPAKSVMGIEPIYLAWKANVIAIIPHRHNRSREIRTPNILVPNQADYQIVLYSVIQLKVAVDGLEPTYHTVWRCCVAITLYCNKISVQGLEPWTFWLRVSCSTIELHRFIMTNRVITWRHHYHQLVRLTGFEPAILRLKAACHTTWLQTLNYLDFRCFCFRFFITIISFIFLFAYASFPVFATFDIFNRLIDNAIYTLSNSSNIIRT